MDMARTRIRILALAAAVCLAPAPAAAQPGPLPTPLTLHDVIRIASERRDEIAAARARVAAADARPAIVSALDDPMISPSLDHLPFSLGGANVSVTLEQQIPLSGVRGHRRAAAVADADRLRAQSRRTVLEVGLEAVNAYLMLHERRRTADLLQEQIAFARDVVNAANARYAGGTAPQSDVLRAEVEVARLAARAAPLGSDIRGAEVMLNASLAIDTDRPVPALAWSSPSGDIPEWADIKSRLAGRPEIAAGRAEIARADAEVQVMRDMFRPMALIRTGPSYTMTDGTGWMAMAGITLPIWRSKLRAGVAEAEATRAMSDADLRAMARMIEADAAVALTTLRGATERRRAITTDVLPRARLAIAPAVAGYAAGQIPLVSVVEAIQAWWLVQSDLITAETDLGMAWARLGRAVGSYEAIKP